MTAAPRPPATVPAFPLEPNDLSLSRPASPANYFGKVGRRAALLGDEGGTAEVWAWPLKLLRNLELQFLLPAATVPIRARDIARHADVAPEASVLTFAHPAFTVRAIHLVPMDRPGVLILLDVSADGPMTILCRFTPVLSPMWPAALGGQAATWDAEARAYLIREATERHHAFIGSPGAQPISNTPDHALSDAPCEFRIPIDDPAAVRGRLIPLAIAGGSGDRADVRATYRGLLADPEAIYRANVRHYRALGERTLALRTPRPELDLAFEWAKVAIDDLFVDHPTLGTGLVAGLGPSGATGRPGFGWFFGGDAFMMAYGLAACGDFAAARQAIAFAGRWQRDDGKIAHELTQAADFVDWFRDYPFGYIHGDTASLFITAVHDYVRASGDLQFLRDRWDAVVRAYRWSVSTDVNGDGLMDNPAAGLGAFEYGTLTAIESDIAMNAVFVRALFAVHDLAGLLGDRALADEAKALYDKALRAFDEKFWDPDLGRYGYAFDARGRPVREPTPWPALGLARGLGGPERAAATLRHLASAELTTDWGVRSLGPTSAEYGPLRYTYGAVWPVLSTWAALAEFRHHFTPAACRTLFGIARHTFDNGLGVVSEVFSGSRNIGLPECVAHQGFSSVGAVLPLARGLLGLEADAPARTVTFAPQLPADWPFVEVRRFRAGAVAFDFRYARSRGRIVLDAEARSGETYRLRFAPVLGGGARVTAVTCDGRAVPFEVRATPRSVQPLVEVDLARSARLEVAFEPCVELLPTEVQTRTGDTDQGLKIVDVTWEGQDLVAEVEGLAGREYRVRVTEAGRIAAVAGAVRTGDALAFTIGGAAGTGFARHRIRITAGPSGPA